MQIFTDGGHLITETTHDVKMIYVIDYAIIKEYVKLRCVRGKQINFTW